MDRVNILDVNIDCLSLQEVLERVKIFLASGDPHYIVTVNPEFLVAATRDMHFRDILNNADISVPDGVGVIKAARGAGKRLVRVTGVDLTHELSHLSAEMGWTLFLLGGRDTVAEKSGEALTAKFPTLKIVGAENGGEINDPKMLDQALIDRIKRSGAQILLVALGHGKQELFIDANLARLPSVHLAIGVGGAFDYWSGRVPRALRLLRRWGFEWLYRLIREPSRLVRILRATVIFPYLALTSRIQKP